MNKRILLACLLFSSIAGASDAIAPFTTDGCSLFPDGNPQHKSLWFQCCIQHDMAYWMGGTEPQRRQADLALEQCVADFGEPEIASLMLAGVRAGGTPYLPSSYRWGYGWPLQRGYQALSPEETSLVESRLNTLSELIQSTLEHLRQARPDRAQTPDAGPDTP